MDDEQLEEIRKAVVALGNELMKFNSVGFQWGMSPYKELKWVQHHPVQYAVECALRHIGKLLKKSERGKITRSLVLANDVAMANRILDLWGR